MSTALVAYLGRKRVGVVADAGRFARFTYDAAYSLEATPVPRSSTASDAQP